MSTPRDYSGWSLVRCPTAADRIPDCEPAWVQAAREFPALPDPVRITDLPDISTWSDCQTPRGASAP